jgi:hypothetical protein
MRLGSVEPAHPAPAYRRMHWPNWANSMRKCCPCLHRIRMPRKHIWKTQRAGFSQTDILSVVKRVVDDDAKVRAVAVESEIDRMTLTRYIKKFQNGELQPHFGYWGNRRVFTEEEEIVLSEYLQTSSKMYFGLTPNEVQKLAYEYADANL